MPDAAGNIKGSGWTRKRAAGWETVFGGRRHAVPPGNPKRDTETPSA